MELRTIIVIFLGSVWFVYFVIRCLRIMMHKNSTHNLHTLLWNKKLKFERRKKMGITIEQCVQLHNEGYETVIDNGKIIGFISEDGEFLKL